MKRSLSAVLGGILIFLLWPQAVGALDPYAGGVLDAARRAWFYNRVGATEAELSAAMTRCAAFGAAAENGAPPPGSNYALVTQWFLSFGATSRANDVSDECMMWSGYRRFDVAGMNMLQLAHRIAELDDAERQALVGVETPPIGQIGRVWGNAYWLERPDEHVATPLLPLSGVPTFSPMSDVVWIGAANRQVTELGPDQAIIVLSVRRIGRTWNDNALSFMATDLSTGQSLHHRVNGHDRVPILNVHMLRGRAAGPDASDMDQAVRVYRAMVVPAGGYSLWAQNANLSITEFCLRTIAFEVRPGEVLYLGDFIASEVAQTATPPVQTAPSGLRLEAGDLERARTAAVVSPDLAQPMTSANWYNGLTTECSQKPRMSFDKISGFSVPGFPFVDAHQAS